jgi:hypothetical protein
MMHAFRNNILYFNIRLKFYSHSESLPFMGYRTVDAGLMTDYHPHSASFSGYHVDINSIAGFSRGTRSSTMIPLHPHLIRIWQFFYCILNH